MLLSEGPVDLAVAGLPEQVSTHQGADCVMWQADVYTMGIQHISS